MEIPMKSVKTFRAIFFLLLFVSLTAAAKDKREWRMGKLVSVTDSSSNRIIGNTQTGAIQTIEDVEYRVSILLDGIVYVGSYWPRTRWSYEPNDLMVNDPIELSIDRNEMYVRRPEGKEFKAKVIRRIRQEDTKSPPPQ
jgi:hypothetical protein